MTQIPTTRAVIEQLVGALENVEGHKLGCKVHAFGDNCTCGFDAQIDAALTAGREALEQKCKHGNPVAACTNSPMDCQCAIDAALAQTEPEPVAEVDRSAAGLIAWHGIPRFRDGTKLYTHPQASEPTSKQSLHVEAVGINGLTEAETSASMSVMGLSKPTVSEPAGGMTDEQISKIALETQTAEPGRDGYILPYSFARAILAAARTQPERVISKAEAETILRTINGLRYDNNSAISEERFHEASEILRNALG